MSELAAGPELDLQVAFAMNVTAGPSYELPRYSTEFGAWTQEMLEWLGHVRIHTLEGKTSTGWAVHMVPFTEHGVSGMFTGDTLPLALARLVVAVAERRGK